MPAAVSVCIPAYCQPVGVARALRSVMNQSYRDFEVVVTDDSPDDIVERVVRPFTADCRVAYYRNPRTLGSPENWNEAVRRSSGRYVKLLHHDDWFLRPDSLARFVALLDRHPAADFAFSAAEIRGHDRKFLSVHAPGPRALARLRRDPEVLFSGNVIGSPSATIYRRRPGLEYDPRLKWLVDVEYYMRLLRRHPGFAHSRTPLVATALGAPGQLTGLCAGDKRLELFEFFYVYRRLSPAGRRSPARVWTLFQVLRAHRVASVGELTEAGVDPVPAVARLLVTFESILRRGRRPRGFAMLSYVRRAVRRACRADIVQRLKPEWVARSRRRRVVRGWGRAGEPAPPPHEVKQATVLEYARRYGLDTLVETGTWHGDMVFSVRRHFRRIMSVELSPALAAAARRRFARDPHVSVHQGDSATVLAELLPKVDTPAVFWLDAHYSMGDTARGNRETPIKAELVAILSHPVRNHVVLIDDARCFSGQNDYPTLEELQSFVAARRPAVAWEVRHDIIRLTPAP
jgi:glycosyltransferase involved in cell wall biosynthesis